jgi:outer membrane protein
MRNVFKKLLMVALLGFASSMFAANTTSVAIVDLTQVFQQVLQGQPAFAALQKKYASQTNQLQDRQNALNKKIQAFQTNQAQMSLDQRNTQQADLIAEQNQLQKDINAYQINLRGQQQKLLTAFSNNMKTAVAEISKNNGYHLVLSGQTAVYSDNTVDITPQVIAAMK